MSGTRMLAKAAGLLMVAQLISRLLGFLRESLLAGLFGRGNATDAYNTAFILPDLLYWLLVGGVLSSAFIPVFSEYLAKDEEDEAWRVTSSVVNLTFLALSALVIFGLIFTPQFVQLEAPQYDQDKKDLTVHLTRMLLMQPLMLGLSGITNGVLNSFKVFKPSAIGALIYSASVIIFGYLLADSMGIAGFAIGVVVGAAANFLVQIPALKKVGLRYYPIIDWKHPGVRRVAILSFPVIVGYAINNLQVAVNSNLGSALPAGGVSALWWSYRLFSLPVGLFAMPISVAVFPTITEYAAKKDWDKFLQTSSGAVRTVLFLTIPVSVGMMVLGIPLIRVLFEHGEFTSSDTLATAAPLFYFSLGIAAQAVIQILPRMFYALQNTWTPVITATIAMGINIVAAITLVKPLAQGGLALATSIAAVVNMFLLFYLLRKRLGHIDGRRILKTTLQTLLASVVMGIVVWLWAKLQIGITGEGMMASLALLITGTAIGTVVFVGMAKLMKMEEFDQAMGLFKRKLKRN